MAGLRRAKGTAPNGKAPTLTDDIRAMMPSCPLNWKSLSAMAGLTALELLFRLYPGAVRSPQVVDFLAALVRHVRQPLLLVWDRLPAHRSANVRDYIDRLQWRIRTEYPSPYAPELNPVEYTWACWKHHELPNVCPKDCWQLS